MKNMIQSMTKANMKKQIVLITILFISVTTLCQTPPDEFFKGLDLLEINQKQAKKEFLLAVKKDSLFYGSYHFLGVIYLNDNQLDSAINSFKKSIDLNTNNGNHTREMAFIRLIDTYLIQQNFVNAFNSAWEAYIQYTDNKIVERYLKDVCLWSFYINHANLDPSYLLKDLKEEYIVNSVDEEYLILRRIQINGQNLIPSGQRLIQKKKTSYDVISCQISESGETIDVPFKLNWDLGKYFGGTISNTKSVYDNQENPIYERIGALLISDPEQDLKQAIEEILQCKNE
jgi:tetratricopeptide (TPR) repeat protein